MKSVVDYFSFLWTRTPDWELILKFLDVLIWPLVVSFAVAMVRPGRIVDAMVQNGGELAVAGTAIRLGQKITAVAADVEDDEETAPLVNETPITNPASETIDPYSTIMNGWAKVIQGLEDAVERTGLPKMDKRIPMETVRELRRRDFVGRKIERNISQLFEVRNRVRRLGSGKLGRIGVDQDVADEYYKTAERVRRGIGRAISLRENRGDIPSSSPRPTGPLEPPPGPLN